MEWEACFYDSYLYPSLRSALKSCPTAAQDIPNSYHKVVRDCFRSGFFKGNYYIWCSESVQPPPELCPWIPEPTSRPNSNQRFYSESGKSLHDHDWPCLSYFKYYNRVGDKVYLHPVEGSKEFLYVPICWRIRFGYYQTEESIQFDKRKMVCGFCCLSFWKAKCK